MNLKLKTVDDFHFVMDSMLFGLGKFLRKCGFKTELIANRENLLKYCIKNPKCIAVSTGKGFRQVKLKLKFFFYNTLLQLELNLPPERIFSVPINTNDPHLNSKLIAFIMRNYNIIIYPKDMLSRCVKCNKRAFIRLSNFIVKTMFYINAVENELDFLEVSENDLKLALTELVQHSIVKESIKTNEKNDLFDDNEYTLTIYESQIICNCKKFSLDLR